MHARGQRGMHCLLKQMVVNVLGDIGSMRWYKQSIKVTHVVQFNQEVHSYSCKVCCVSRRQLHKENRKNRAGTIFMLYVRISDV